MNLKNAHAQLSELFGCYREWLMIRRSGASFSLGNDEIETVSERGKLIISFLDDHGYQTWRIDAFRRTGNELTIDLTRNFGTESRRVRFVPRVSAEELGDAVSLALIEKAHRIARLFVAGLPRTKLVRVSLNKPNGRFAQIICQQNRTKIAAMADLSDSATPEVLLSNAIIWLKKLQLRKKDPIGELWVLTSKRLAGKLPKLHALLRPAWKHNIRICKMPEWFPNGGPDDVQPESEYVPVKPITIKGLWREKPAKLVLPDNPLFSDTAQSIIGIAPDRIDHVFTKHGETLRFYGLPFARVRTMSGREKCWFGIEPEKRLLSEKTQDDFAKLIADLEDNRRFDSPYKRHEFYRQSPEAWLHSILRRNIKLLDANLILSPIYNQFRSSRDRIDLLAIRSDGRLIIIELKTAPDREMIFQAVDYWRKIELQRRKGLLNAAKLFGELPIADRPTLVYLVSPTLSYHRDFRFLAGTISEEIDIYRFDLAENWRERVRVLRREKLL